MRTTTLAIEGMSCQHCVRHVTRALDAVPGVTVREVKLGEATVETTGEPAVIDAIVRALADAAYPARPTQAR
jgi:copper chaperone CopZ